MDFLKRSIYSFLLVTLGVVLISFAMAANGSALPNNPAWDLIKNLRLILLWIAAVPTVIFLIIKYVAWLDSERHKRDLEAKMAIEKLIELSTRPIQERQFALAEQVQEIKRRLDKIEREQLHEKTICEKLEIRKNQSAEVVTTDALSEFL